VSISETQKRRGGNTTAFFRMVHPLYLALLRTLRSDRLPALSFVRLRPTWSCAVASGVCLVVGAVTWSTVRSSEPGLGALPSARQARAQGEVADRIAETIRSSRGVLAIANDPNSAYVEILLWRSDIQDPGALNRSELLLISHSRVLGTISTYRAAPPEAERDAAGPASFAEIGRSDDDAIEPATVQQRVFLDQWRSAADIAARVLACDLSDVDVRVSGEEDGAGEAVLDIQLIWTSDSADFGVKRTVRTMWAAPQSVKKEQSREESEIPECRADSDCLPSRSARVGEYCGTSASFIVGIGDASWPS